MKLRLRSKVFLGLFFLASLMTIMSGYIFYHYQATTLKDDYLKNHNAIAEMIANNLKQAEDLIPTKQELQELPDLDHYINIGSYLKGEIVSLAGQ